MDDVALATLTCSLLTWKNSEVKSEKPLTSVSCMETRTVGILRFGMGPVVQMALSDTTCCSVRVCWLLHSRIFKV